MFTWLVRENRSGLHYFITKPTKAILFPFSQSQILQQNPPPTPKKGEKTNNQPTNNNKKNNNNNFLI